jgi:hypothetical protein
MAKKNDGIGDLVRGALTGIAATWVMGRVAGLLAESDGAGAISAGETAGDEGAPADLHPVASNQPEWLLSLDNYADGSGSPGGIPWELGAGAGVAYGILRGRVPGADAACGLLFGAGLYFAVDRSADRSARGALPWLGYGAGAHLTMRALDRVSSNAR